MKRVACLALAVVLTTSSHAFAQAAPGGGQPTGVAANLQAGYARLKMLVTQSADKLGEADYAFKPTPEIRGFGQLWTHVANSQYNQCATAKGVPNPNQGNNLEETATTKAQVMKAVADSFAFCDDVFAKLTDQTALEPVTGGRGGPTMRANVLTSLLTHGNEMYGIGTVYLRLKGQVPPSTEAQQQNRGGGAGGQGGGRRGGGAN